MREPLLIHDMDVVEPEIEVLVYRMQRPADLEIVLELNRDLLAHQGLEDREEKLHRTYRRVRSMRDGCTRIHHIENFGMERQKTGGRRHRLTICLGFLKFFTTFSAPNAPFRLRPAMFFFSWLWALLVRLGLRARNARVIILGMSAAR